MNPIPAAIAEGLANEMVNLAGTMMCTSHDYHDNYRDNLSTNHVVKRKIILRTHPFKGEQKVSLSIEEDIGNQVVGRLNIDDVISIVLDTELVVTAEGVTLLFPVDYPEPCLDL